MKYKFFPAVCASVGMCMLILDAKTALNGASEGITLCLKTVIPSLFPFLLLSAILTASLSKFRLPFSRAIGKLLRIPQEGVSIYLIGLLGGYPAGAQSVAVAYRSGILSQNEAKRMAVFCNNAGPAFFFGFGAVVFDSLRPCFLLWLIQILSSIALARLMPAENNQRAAKCVAGTIPSNRILRQTLESMALICSWVVLFRILLSILQRWFLWLLPVNIRVLFCGLLEMTNGCCDLPQLLLQGERLLYFAVFATFGGLCIHFQTYSVTAAASVPMIAYLPGKMAQGCIALLLASAAQWLLPSEQRAYPATILLLISAVYCFMFAVIGWKTKKGVAFPRNFMYNKEKSHPRGNQYAVSRKY